MTLKIYNSLTRKKEKFVPVDPNKVKMYVCGMTVYSDAHIGHARTYLAFDVIRRYLEYKSYEVTYVQNITDVDDKIIAAANKEGVEPLEYSKRYTKSCLDDMRNLGIRDADMYPKASETIEDMIDMVEQLVEKKYAYVTDGDVYFSVEKFDDYGKLSGQNIEEMKEGARVQPDEQKLSPLDFALWKKAKTNEPSWDSPWGQGRPGWHIECSTMSSKHLGLPFDIHGGGMDLKFPHHENEIAQAEAATGKEFAKYWMHVGLLTVEGEKMSKSVGNIINIRDAVDTWAAETLRFFFVQAHYRSPPDFNEKALDDVRKALDKLHRFKEKMGSLFTDSSGEVDVAELSSAEKQYLDDIEMFEESFERAMDDDFNTPQAIASMFEFVNKSNSFLKQHETPDSAVCKKAYETFVRLGSILTLFQEERRRDEDMPVDKLASLVRKHGGNVLDESSGEALIGTLLRIREKARRERQWEKADAIRDDLEKLGFEIEDTDSGAVWRKT